MNEPWLQSQTIQRLDKKLAGNLSKKAWNYQFTALLGPRHSGKTRVLQTAVQTVAARQGWAAILLSLYEPQSSASTTEEFFGEVLTQLREKMFKYRSTFAAEEHYDSQANEISSAQFCDRVKRIVREIGRDLFIAFDHLETLPEFFASELLQALRTFSSLPAGAPRVVTVVASTLPITNLSTGEISPYYNIAQELYAGNLSEQDNQDIAKELLPDTDDEFRARLLSAAQGDLGLLTWVCDACVVKAKADEREVPSLKDLKETISDFLEHEARTHPVFVEAQQRIATSPRLLVCMADLIGSANTDRKSRVADPETGTALWLTALVSRNEDGSYSLRNEIYRRYLHKYYSLEKLGQSLAATGYWERGTDLLIKHYSANLDTDDVQPLLDFAVTAAFVAKSLEEAVSRLTRVLETVFPVRTPRFWLQSTDGVSLRCVHHCDEGTDGETNINIDDPRPEARAWKTGNVLTSDSGARATFPLISHSNKRVGVVTLYQWKQMMQTADRPKRIRDLRDFLYKAARPLAHLIAREQREAERSLLENELPRLIAKISMLADVGTLPKEALNLLSASEVLPFRRAAIQLLNAHRNSFKVCAFNEETEIRPDGGFPGPPSPEEIVAGNLNLRVLSDGKPIIWPGKLKAPLYAAKYGYRSRAVKDWMGIPLIANKEILGILTFYHAHAKQEYSDNHEGLARQIADSIAGRIHEARQSERQRQERELLHEITRSMQNLEKTWTNILEGTMKLTGAEAGNIGLIDRDKNQITIPVALVKNAQGESEPMKAEELRAHRFSTDLDSDARSIMSYVTVNRCAVNIPDVRSKKWKGIYKTLHPNTGSEIAVPIFKPKTDDKPGADDNEVVGIINLESPRLNAFRNEDLALLKELTVHVYFAVHNAQLYKLLRVASLRSAVTAIMARNMSHNIGSHSLSYLSNKETLSLLTSADATHAEHSDELTSHMNGYIRERMDFIASIPSLNPTWAMPLDLIKDVFNPVWGRGEDKPAPRLFLLLNTIARSEQIYAPALRLNVCIRDGRRPGAQETFTYGYAFKKGSLVYETPDLDKAYDLSRKIAVYMGTTGLQAMYGLMENFIRNSAKHSPELRLSTVRSQNAPDAETGNPAKALNVTMEFTYNFDVAQNHAANDLVRLHIYDNMGGWTDEVGATINDNLDKFLGPEDCLVEGYWGLKEMRICASFLRGLMINEYEAVHDPPILQAEARDMEGIGRSLGYVLYLPRVKECLILGPAPCLGEDAPEGNDWTNQGVYTVDSLETLEELKRAGGFNHAAVLIDVEDACHAPQKEDSTASANFVTEFFQNPTHFPAKTLLTARNTEALERALQASPQLLERKISVCCPDEQQIVQAAFPSALLRDAEKTSSADWQAFHPGERAVSKIKAAWLQKQIGLTPFPKLQILNEVNKYKTKKSDDWVDLLIERSDDLTDAIVFNHGWHNLREHPALLPSCRFYAPYRSSPPGTLNGLVEVMNDTGSYNFGRLSAYFELLEAALTNIIVIDERIFGDSLHRRHLQGADDVLLNPYLTLQNIAVFDIPQKGKLAGVAHSEDLIHRNSSAAAPRVRRFSPSNLEALLKASIPSHFESQVHFLILHHTILQKKLGGHENLPRFLEAMGVYRPRWVVITSGRGRPEKVTMPPSARFLEYSNLRRFTIQDTDKVLLSRMLWSLKDG